MKEVDMVTKDERRWTPGLYGLPHRFAKIKDLENFDAYFFGVHPKQANVMDPQLRLMLEVTYETIVDAGFNPSMLKKSRIGVFIGVSTAESDEFWTAKPERVNGLYDIFQNLDFTFPSSLPPSESPSIVDRSNFSDVPMHRYNSIRRSKKIDSLRFDTCVYYIYVHITKVNLKC